MLLMKAIAKVMVMIMLLLKATGKRLSSEIMEKIGRLYKSWKMMCNKVRITYQDKVFPKFDKLLLKM